MYVAQKMSEIHGGVSDPQKQICENLEHNIIAITVTFRNST